MVIASAHGERRKMNKCIDCKHCETGDYGKVCWLHSDIEYIMYIEDDFGACEDFEERKEE